MTPRPKDDDIFTELSEDDINKIDNARIAKLKAAEIDEETTILNAKEELRAWEGYWADNKARGLEDQDFVLKDQWSASERAQFQIQRKPCLQFNKLYDSTKKIIAQQRKNMPELLVRSLTGKSSQQDIDLRQDMLRTIAYQSQHNLVYQQAARNALYMGWGAWQVCIEYQNRSFNKNISVKPCLDNGRVFFDPKAQLPHKGDGDFCGILYTWPRKEFYAAYPFALEAESFRAGDSNTHTTPGWTDKTSIVFVDYYKKEWYSLKLYLLSDGSTVSEEEWEDMEKQFEEQRRIASISAVPKLYTDNIPHVVGERNAKDFYIRHYRMTQNQIIEFANWPGKHLPIIFVDGDSHFIDGQQYTRSFISDAKDAQKFTNYVGSEIAGEIKNRRREQWIGTPTNIIGNDEVWRNPETEQGILLATPDPRWGNSLPQKMPAWDLSPTLLTQFQRGSMDIKEILGFNESSLGQEDNADSGKAIGYRQMAGSDSAYVYQDNLNQALEQSGRCILDLLPAVYGGSERRVVLTNANGQTRPVKLNEKQCDNQVKNSITPGDFDVEIRVGPSLAIQKQMSVNILMSMVSAAPQAILPLCADIIAENLDIEKSIQLTDRFKTLVPPQIIAKEAGEPPPQQQPSPQDVAMQQQQQLHQSQMAIAEQELQARKEELAIRAERHQIEKQELALKAQKMQEDMATNRVKFHAELQKNHITATKNDQEYAVRMAKTITDAHR